MKRKPASSKSAPKPTVYPSPSDEKLWREIVTIPMSPGRLELLAQALQCRNRLIAIGKEIEQGEFSTELLTLENDVRREFTRMWTALNLNWRQGDSG
jgi:hypothetical protein